MLLLFSVAVGIAAGVEALKTRGTRRGIALSIWILACGTVALGAARGGFGAQKVVGHILMPTGLIWMSLFGLAVAELRRHRGSRAAFLLGLFLAYSASGSVLLGNRLVVRLEAEVPSPKLDASKPFDVVFVLGGGTKLAPSGVPELAHGGDRLRRAAALWHADSTTRLVASGFSPPPFGAGDLSWASGLLWRDMGVPPDAVRYLSKPVNTSEEIKAYKTLSEAEGWTNLGLVSSAWHLPRALALCRREGLKVVPLPADHRGERRLGFDALWLIPQPMGFELVGLWAWETLGRAVGR